MENFEEDLDLELIVLSYRGEWLDTCQSGCCTYGGVPADMEFHLLWMEHHAADWIAQRIHRAPHAPFCHIILDNWNDVLGLTKDIESLMKEGVESIIAPPHGYHPTRERDPEEDKRKEAQASRIRQLVETRLKELEQEAQERKKQKEAERKKEEEAEREARARAQYEELKKQFG